MAGADFDALPPSLTIPSGSTSGALTVTARDDDRVEDTETFGISLISSDSLVIVTNPSSADINITDTTCETNIHVQHDITCMEIHADTYIVYVFFSLSGNCWI